MSSLYRHADETWNVCVCLFGPKQLFRNEQEHLRLLLHNICADGINLFWRCATKSFAFQRRRPQRRESFVCILRIPRMRVSFARFLCAPLVITYLNRCSLCSPARQHTFSRLLLCGGCAITALVRFMVCRCGVCVRPFINIRRIFQLSLATKRALANFACWDSFGRSGHTGATTRNAQVIVFSRSQYTRGRTFIATVFCCRLRLDYHLNMTL